MIDMLKVPTSLEEEHKELMDSIEMLASGDSKIAKSVKQILIILEPHFEKEEETVVPVLGSLGDLASGIYTDLEEVKERSDALREDYANMLEEHRRIREKVEAASVLAKAEGREDVLNILELLSHHAAVEEEILYPAALLAGKLASMLIIRERSI
ncbi:MAG: hemerythrin domain-containing protein [Nitrososphaerota archaeon]|jgi:iron-sulfur cluster repair protein YtfE (RIC family)|nr:hemerythrin domain-containing protein [Nitrososphaerota archaeon]